MVETEEQRGGERSTASKENKFVYLISAVLFYKYIIIIACLFVLFNDNHN